MLEDKVTDVERLLRYFYGKRILQSGMTLEEARQHVWVRLLHLEATGGGWNPDLGTFPTYFKLVAGQAITNISRRERMLKRGFGKEVVLEGTESEPEPLSNIGGEEVDLGAVLDAGGLLEALTPRQRQVAEDWVAGIEMWETGKTLGVTRQRVDQIRKQITEKAKGGLDTVL